MCIRDRLNPWAIIAGLILGPIVFVALIGGLLKVGLTMLWPGMAEWWAWGAAQPVRWMRGTVDWLATFPWGDVPVPPPALWVIALFYLILLSGRFRVSRRGFG